MPILSKVENREALKARRDPYWHCLRKGCYLGFRKMTATSQGNWIARHRDEATGKQSYRKLGDFGDLTPGQRFDAARKQAELWFDHIGAGGSNEELTITEACSRYVAHIRETRGARAAHDIQARFQKYVLNNPKFAATKLEKLQRRHFDDWRREHRKRPCESGPNRGQPRSDATLNRDMTCLRAALNFAKESKDVITDTAWREALSPIEAAEKQREAYLDPEQRRALIRAASEDLGAFLWALCHVPLRPGAMAALTVANFDKRLQTITIGKDKKTGHARKIALPEATAAKFAEFAINKLPTAPLISRANGSAWNKDAWKWPIKTAVEAAGLPPSTTAYALRHSVITDLVQSGLDLLTVAQLSGTSLRMIEKHYKHLTGSHSREALARLAL
ncbi:tyrosine-type recombinase/integrase [Inhella proteolytica]|uniref:Site-specific integrase n=1 Tax=Inhella proteolytica TaxID=2795029 RepID=A0A931J1F1_9BURK|nr:site-specific integrase [Inhella proteolytica]MBH9577764.1 site-specific integrase [Inhella proteolytica]